MVLVPVGRGGKDEWSYCALEVGRLKWLNAWETFCMVESWDTFYDERWGITRCVVTEWVLGEIREKRFREALVPPPGLEATSWHELQEDCRCGMTGGQWRRSGTR